MQYIPTKLSPMALVTIFALSTGCNSNTSTKARTLAEVVKDIPGAHLVESATDFKGTVPSLLNDPSLQIVETDWNFDIHKQLAADGSHKEEATTNVAVAGLPVHNLDFQETMFPMMSDHTNTLVLTDKSSNNVRTYVWDQDYGHFKVMDGSATLTLDHNPDGTWMVNGQPAATAQDAARLGLASPVISGASLHSMAGLYGLLEGQKHLITEPTLGNCNGSASTADDPEAVVKAVIQMEEQQLQQKRLRG